MSTPSLDPLKDASLNILHFENNAAATLQQQGKLLQLLQSESSYLNEKQQIVKDAETASDRLIGFNQNFSKRYVEYIKMIVVMVIGLGMMIFMIVLTKMNILSNTMGTILSMVFVSISAIIVAKMYFVIQNRDHMNYDRVLTTAPPDSTFNKANSVIATTSGSGINGVCFGAQCCDLTGTIWNMDTNTCIKKEGFTSSQPDPSTPLFSTNGDAPSVRDNISTWINASNDKYSVLDSKPTETKPKETKTTKGKTTNITKTDISGATAIDFSSFEPFTDFEGDGLSFTIYK